MFLGVLAATLPLAFVSEALSDLRGAYADLSPSSHPQISAGVTIHSISENVAIVTTPSVFVFLFHSIAMFLLGPVTNPQRLCPFLQTQRKRYFSVLFNGELLLLFFFFLDLV